MGRAARITLTTLLGIGAVGGLTKFGTHLITYPFNEIEQLKTNIKSLKYARESLNNSSEINEAQKREVISYFDRKQTELNSRHEEIVNEHGSVEHNTLLTMMYLLGAIVISSGAVFVMPSGRPPAPNYSPQAGL